MIITVIRVTLVQKKYSIIDVTQYMMTHYGDCKDIILCNNRPLMIKKNVSLGVQVGGKLTRPIT